MCFISIQTEGMCKMSHRGNQQRGCRATFIWIQWFPCSHVAVIVEGHPFTIVLSSAAEFHFQKLCGAKCLYKCLWHFSHHNFSVSENSCCRSPYLSNISRWSQSHAELALIQVHKSEARLTVNIVGINLLKVSLFILLQHIGPLYLSCLDVPICS